MFEPLRTWKDWMDQVLHASLAGAMTYLFALNIGLFGGAVAMGIMVVREVWYQHKGHCHAGCRTDLLGSFVGTVIASIIFSF